jgi:hypothetical protein
MNPSRKMTRAHGPCSFARACGAESNDPATDLADD